MGTNIKIIIHFLPILILTSCVNLDNELDFERYVTNIVIEGLVIDSQGKSFVKLSLTSPYGDSVSINHINNAVVNIVEDDSINYAFNLSSDGYYTHSSFIGKVNSMYSLIISYQETEYIAKSKLLPVCSIDSLVPKVISNDIPASPEYKVKVYAKRSSEEFTSYYIVRIYKNGILYNSYPDLLIVSDAYLESFNNLTLPKTFTTADTVKVELYSISEQIYDYYDEMIGLINGSLNTVYFSPKNPKTNISNGALGIFQVSSFSSAEIGL